MSAQNSETAASKRKNHNLDELWGECIGEGWAAIPKILMDNQSKLKINSTEMCIIMHLIYHQWEKNKPSFPSKKMIAEKIGVTIKTIQANTRSLECKKLIKREARKTADGGFGSNYYHLNGLREALDKIYKEEQATNASGRKLRRGKAEDDL